MSIPETKSTKNNMGIIGNDMRIKIMGNILEVLEGIIGKF